MVELKKVDGFKIYPYLIGDRVNPDVSYDIAGFEVSTLGDKYFHLKWDEFSSKDLYTGIAPKFGNVFFDKKGSVYFGIDLGSQGAYHLVVGECGVESMFFLKGRIARDDLQDRLMYSFVSGVADEILSFNGVKNSGLEILAKDVCMKHFFDFNKKNK